MADAPPTSSPGIVGRLTAKAGPLPVWAWALLILVGGYLVYRFTSTGKTTAPTDPTEDTTATTGATTDQTPISAAGDESQPGGSGQGSAAGNLNDDLLSQFQGFQGSIDSLTAAVQSSPAFWPGSGDSGAGSIVNNDGSTPLPNSVPTAKAAPKATTKAAPKPAAAPVAAAKLKYWTYAPGKAPKGQAANQAPAKGPAGTSLHFAKGKGYYYA